MEEEISMAGAGQASPDPSRALPDPKICRTRSIGSIEAFADCLVSDPANCPYALGFDFGYFCSRPNWKDFAEPESNAAVAPRDGKG